MCRKGNSVTYFNEKVEALDVMSRFMALVVQGDCEATRDFGK